MSRHSRGRHHRAKILSSASVIYRQAKSRASELQHGRPFNVFAVCVRDVIRYNPERDYERYEERFSGARDPYGYEKQPYEQGRFERAAAMLDAFRGGRRFSHALEVGSHEGAFTELLLDRCDSITATDQSPVMIRRTEQRLRAWQHVRSLRWNLCTDPVPGVFDLVLLMDVLECIHRPRVLRSVRDKVVESLAPGGCLLVTNSTVNDELEKAGWARLFNRGGRRINDFVAQHPQLQVLQHAEENRHVLTSFRKSGSTSG